MKIAPAAAERFAGNIMNENARIVVIYGPDAGAGALLAEKIRASFTKKHTDGDVCNYAFDHIKSESMAFRDELYARSFFTAHRLFKVSGCTGSPGKDIMHILETYQGEDIIVLLAGELTPASPLRKFAEKNEYTAAIACYKDDGRSIGAYLQSYIHEHGLQADRDAIQLLTAALPGDRMLVTRELEKLALYIHPDTHITAAHVHACVDLDGEAPLNTLCHAVFEGHILAAAALYQAFLADNGAGSGIAGVRAAQHRIRRLLELHRAIDAGRPPDEAVKHMRPPIFFKDMPSYVKQIRRYTPERLRRLLVSLQDAEMTMKSSAVDPDVAGLQALLLTAYSA